MYSPFAGPAQPEVAPVLPQIEERLRGFLDELDRRDGYVSGHSMAVCRLAVRIGRALDIGEEDLAHLAVGALMHDIGKVFIDGRVLAKPTRLTKPEWETIRLHPALGEALLAPGLFKETVLGIVRWHHERWDGAGYPDGLGGQSIPLGARIVAAADAFSAMCESRVYRPARSLDDAAQELERTSWTQFDGLCVRALVDSLN
jgi:putative two-component system response regulator